MPIWKTKNKMGITEYVKCYTDERMESHGRNLRNSGKMEADAKACLLDDSPEVVTSRKK